MKLLKRFIDPTTKEGYVVLIPEESEDLWQIYNLVAKGDTIKAVTYRKVEKTQTSGTVSKERRKLQMVITINKELEYDPEGDKIRFGGINAEQSEFVALGAAHTISLELNEKIEIRKECWDSVYLSILEEATDVGKNSEVCCILMDQSIGLVQFFFLTSVLAKVVQKIQVQLPKNRKFEKANFEKALMKFYERIVDGIVKHIDFEQIKCVVCAGPGFLKSEFMKYLKADNGANCQAIGIKRVNECFIEAQCSTANKQGLQELLSDDAVSKRIAQTKAFSQASLLEEFYKRLQVDPDRACYGVNQVQVALDNNAVETLLVTDSLFRSRSIHQRRRYVNMVDETRELVGRKDAVVVFSSQHVSGEKLNGLSGVAALLRFPVENLSDIDSSDDEEMAPAEEPPLPKDDDDDEDDPRS